MDKRQRRRLTQGRKRPSMQELSVHAAIINIAAGHQTMVLKAIVFCERSSCSCLEGGIVPVRQRGSFIVIYKLSRKGSLRVSLTLLGK